MSKQQRLIAVTYCRVSSVRQVKEGSGLTSQAIRCSEYAKYKNYEVIHVFQDEGISGSLIERPGMQEMLNFIRKQKEKPCIVLIDDISRLARGLAAHIELRTAISAAGGKLESPSIEFGEDSDSVLVENLLASVSQHSRQKNAEQVSHRMRARALNGYCVTPPVPGYQYKKVAGHGKLLVRDELANIVQTALESFASGRFQTLAEVTRYLNSQPTFPKGKSSKVVHPQRVADMLRRPIYAGYLNYPTWNINMILGHHEPIISYETFKKIQERLDGKAKVPARKDISHAFPLRGFIVCACCQKAMTACFSQGRSRKYPYYFCATKGCSSYKRTIAREKIESEFENLLKQLKPSKNLFNLAHAIFKDLWEERMINRHGEIHVIKNHVLKIENQIMKMVDRVVETDSPTLVATYEDRIRNLEDQKITLKEKIAQCGTALPDFDTAFHTAFDFLENPYKMWASGQLEHQRSLLKLTFTDNLAYDRNSGFRTAKTTLPFAVLNGISKGNYGMVELSGIEPLTSTLPVSRSPS